MNVRICCRHDTLDLIALSSDAMRMVSEGYFDLQRRPFRRARRSHVWQLVEAKENDAVKSNGRYLYPSSCTSVKDSGLPHRFSSIRSTCFEATLIAIRDKLTLLSFAPDHTKES